MNHQAHKARTTDTKPSWPSCLLRELRVFAFLLPAAACAHGPSPEEVAAAAIAGALDPATVDVAAWRDERPEDLQALVDALVAHDPGLASPRDLDRPNCLTPGVCALRMDAGWALDAPDGAAYLAERERLAPLLDHLERTLDDVEGLVRRFSGENAPRISSAYGRFAALAAAETDPLKAELFARTAHDQFVQTGINDALAGQTISPEDFERVIAVNDIAAGRAFAQNALWLKDVVAERGWFTIGRDGEQASEAAWLIVQHADFDPAWQGEMLALMEPFAREGDVSRRNYAYLYDRVAVNTGGLQRYGTQGGAPADGGCGWEPRPIEEPVAELDARRAEMDLEPFAEYAQGLRSFTCRRTEG